MGRLAITVLPREGDVRLILPDGREVRVLARVEGERRVWLSIAAPADVVILRPGLKVSDLLIKRRLWRAERAKPHAAVQPEDEHTRRHEWEELD